MRGEDGKPDRTEAGVTWVHDPGHWLVRTYPELFAPESKHARRQRPAAQHTRPSRTAPRRPLLVLDLGKTPSLTVRLCVAPAT